LVDFKLLVYIDGQETQVHEVTKSPVYVGRDSSLDIVIDDPTVSRRHAGFSFKGERCAVKHFDSTNGLVINGKEITDLQVIPNGTQVYLTERIYVQMVIVSAENDEPGADFEDLLDNDLADINNETTPPAISDSKATVEVKRINSESSTKPFITPDSEPKKNQSTQSKRPKTSPSVKDTPEPATATNSTSKKKESKPATETRRNLRQGCPYCFRTLDNNDADTQLRAIVKVTKDKKSIIYHKVCWGNYKLTAGINFEETQYKVEDYKIPVQTQALIAIDKKPFDPTSDASNIDPDALLRPSLGRIKLDSSNPDDKPPSFIVTNNSNVPQKLSRYHMPAWAFVDYGNYDDVSEWITLEPGESTEVTIFVHPIRPAKSGTRLPLNEKQQITLILDYTKGAFFRFVIPIILTLLFLHIWFYFSWLGSSPNYVPSLFLTSLTWGILWGWLYFMMPARFTWFAFAIIDRATEKRGSRTDNIRQVLWDRFSEGYFVQTYQNPIKLFVESLIVAASVAAIFLPIWYLLNWVTFGITSIIGFLGIGFFALLGLYILGILGLFNYLLLEYRFSVFEFMRKVINQIRASVK